MPAGEQLHKDAVIFSAVGLVISLKEGKQINRLLFFFLYFISYIVVAVQNWSVYCGNWWKSDFPILCWYPMQEVKFVQQNCIGCLEELMSLNAVVRWGIFFYRRTRIVVIVSWASPAGSERPPPPSFCMWVSEHCSSSSMGLFPCLKINGCKDLPRLGPKGLAVYFQAPNLRWGGSDSYG